LDAYLLIAAESPEDNLSPFFVAVALSGSGQATEAAERLRDLSRRIANRGENISRAVAEELFSLLNEEPMLSVPGVAELIVTCGDHLKGEGFVQESAVCFEIAAGLLPNHANVLHKLGDTLHDLGAYDYAEAVLSKALELSPNHWGALYTYAVLLQDLGRFDKAIALYEKAITLYPDHVKCQNNYGAALLLTGRLDEALVHCTLAARLDPDFPLIKINLGNIHLQKKEYELARGCFQEALDMDGECAPAYFGLGAVEQSAGGKPDLIRDYYLKAIELNPENPQFHKALGDLLASKAT
jgi:tetratricopeptide (TPR) repeat protein